MLKKGLTYIENVALIVGVGVAVHYVAGLDWPWALVIGAVVSIVVRWLIDRGGIGRARKRPEAFGRRPPLARSRR